MKSVRIAFILTPLLALALLPACSKKKTNPVSPSGGGTTNTVSTVVVMGTPAYSPTFGTDGYFTMAIVPQNTSGNTIPVNNTQVTFTVDSAKAYAVVVDQVTMRQPASGPLGVCMNFDGSGSMSSSDPSRLRVTAGKQFLRQLLAAKPTSQAAVSEFGVGSGDEYYFHLWHEFALVSDTAALFSVIDSLTEYGSTPLYTSLRRSLEHTDSTLSASQYARCVLSFSDGGDNDSYAEDTLGAIISLANAKSIPIYAVGLGDGVVTEDLQRLASQTGGIYAWADSAAALNALFNAMGLGLTEGYCLVQAHFTTIPTAGLVLDGQVTVTAGGGHASAPILFNIPYPKAKGVALKD